MQFIERNVSIDDLLLDPNNYRFHDQPSYKIKQQDRFHEGKIQEETYKLLLEGPFDVKSLRDSIFTNGFVPLEQIVVRPYSSLEGKLVVVEGNRRVAAAKLLLAEETSGAVELSEALRQSLQMLRVLVLNLSGTEVESASKVIMAIRHVRGPREWGAYQQAKLVQELMGEPGASFSVVAQKLGSTSIDIGRRYRAIKALEHMRNDEEYGAYFDPQLYVMFQEVMITTPVKKWLKWDENTFTFPDDERAREFYGLLVDTEECKRKLRISDDIRKKLKHIVDNEAALRILLDPDKTLDDAYDVTRPAAAQQKEKIEDTIRKTVNALQDIPLSELRGLDDEGVSLLQTLIQKIQDTLAAYRTLVGSNGNTEH